jgi:hypothetical protein
MKRFCVNVETRIFVDAENSEAAALRVFDIMNTAYRNGEKSAIFKKINLETDDEYNKEDEFDFGL